MPYNINMYMFLRRNQLIFVEKALCAVWFSLFDDCALGTKFFHRPTLWNKFSKKYVVSHKKCLLYCELNTKRLKNNNFPNQTRIRTSNTSI